MKRFSFFTVVIACIMVMNLFTLAETLWPEDLSALNEVWTEKAQNPSWWPYQHYDARRSTAREDMVEYYADMEPPCPTNRTVEAFYGNTWGTAELVSTNIQLVATDDPFKEVPGYWPTFYGAAAYLDGKYMIATGQMCNFALRSAETKLTFPGMDNYCKFVKDGTKNGDLTDYGYFWPSNTFEEGFSFNRSVQFNIYDVSKDSWDSSKWDGSGPPTYIDMQSDKCGARWIYDDWVVQEAVSVDGVRSGNGQAFLYDFDESGTPSFFVHGGYPSWDGTFSIYNPNRKPITDPESPYGAWSGSSAASNFSSGYKCQYGGGAVCIDGIAYVIGGGFWGNGSCCMQTYNTKSDQWTSYENIYSDNLIDFGISKWGSKIYIVGDSRVSSKIRIMETATNVFKLVDSDLELQIPVRDVSVACYKDVIYAMGGRTKDESNALIPLDTVQIVDMNRRTSLVHDTKLPVASYYASCDVTEYGKLLFGGSMLARDQQTGKDVACSRFWASYLPNEGLDDITINAVTSEGGTLSVSPAQEQYAYGDVITITATPGSGYELKRAYCDDFETTNLVSSYTVTHSTTIRAEFTKRVDPGVLFYEDFEDYAVGTEVVGTVDGWNFYSTYEGNTTVVDDAPGIDGKAMLLSRSSGGSDEYVMVFTPSFNLDIENPAVGLVRISTRVVIASDQDLFALYDKNGSRYFYLNGNRSAGTLESGPSGVKFTNLYTDASTPNEISIIWDPFAKKIVQIICNGEVKDCEISPNGTCEQPSRLRLSTRLGTLNGATGSYYDFIGVSSFARSSDPLLCCDEEAVIPLDAASIEFDIFNAGSSSSVINYSVSTDSPWLEVTPSSGSFNESATLTLKPKNGLAEGFYRGSMTVDGGAAGTQIVSVMCSKGDVIFAEDFNTMEDGNIVGQRGWTVDVGNVVITNAYNCDEKCMFAYRAGGNNGCSKYLPKPWYENLVVKVSFDMYWPSDSDAEFFYVLQKDSDTNEKFEAHIYPADDGFELYNILARSAQSIGDFPTAPYDTWVQVEYTIDFRANMLLSFGWNGTVTNFTNFTLKNPDCNFFNSWGIAAWSGEANGSRIAVDNLMIKRVACEGDSKLMLPSYKAIGTNDSIDIQMKNGGTDSFDYTAEVIDLSDALTITNPTGTVDASANLSISVDRSGLKDNFYRSRIKVDAGEAGCATCIVSFVKGDVYYYADFEEPFFTLGDITGQDEWGNDNQNGNVAYVLSTNDTQVLMVETGGGWGGYFHDLQVPANKLVRFDCDFFFPPDIFDREDLIGREVIYLKQNSKFMSAADITLDIDFVDGVPIVYGHDHANDCIYSTTEYTEEWMHVSYVIDYKEGKLVEFAINGNTEHPADAYINEEYVGSGCNLFCMCVTYEGNIQFDNVSVRTIPTTTGFDLTTSSSEGGTIAIAPVKEKYTYGDVVTIKATPNFGYKLKRVYCDDFETKSLVSAYTVTHSTTITAEFKKYHGPGTNEVLRIDFEQDEGYQLGDIFTQGKGWQPLSAANSNCYGQVVNKEKFANIRSGEQALLAGARDTSYAKANFCVDFDISSVDIDEEYVQFEIQVKPSEAGSGSYQNRFLIYSTNNVSLIQCLVFNGGFWCNAYSMEKGENDWAFNPSTYQGGPELIIGKPHFDEFTTVTFTWDLSEQQLLSIKLGDEMCYYTNRWDPVTGVQYECNANIPYGINPKFSGLPSRLVIVGQNECPEAGYDAFVVRTISKSQTDEIVINTASSEGGTIAIAPVKGNYTYGDVVTITATPDPGYELEKVYCDDFETTNLVSTYTVTHSTTFRAKFRKCEYKCSVTTVGEGSVTISPEKEVYYYGDVLTLTAIPETNYAFEGFSGSVTSTDDTVEVTVTNHLDITATFYFDAYKLNLTTGSGGSVTVVPDKETYHLNEKVTLTAVPDEGYAFYGYTGTAESTNLVLKVTMDQHHEIAAAFYFDAYTLTLTTSEGGTVTVDPEKETYHRNEVVTLTAVPDEGYAFEGYTGTAESTNLVLKVTMDQHHEIAAAFYFDAYTLTLTTSEGGTVTVEPEKETYHNEEEVTISANPEVGYAFANYSGTLESTDNPLVIKMTQHYELTANFTNLEYVVTCDVAEGGSIVLDPQKSSYHYNDEVGYSVELEKGYSFVEIQGYEQVLTNATGTITVTDNLTLTPVFELEEYSMTCVSTFGGSVAIEPAKDSYHYNDVIIIETTPDNGYVLRQLLVNGEAIEGSTYVIEGDTEIKAVFVYGDEKPSGKGTEEAPYTIANVANLLWLSRNTKTTVGAYSVLSADIDLSLCEDWLDGLGFEPIGSEAEPFQGYFDGRSFSIKGLYVNDPDMEGAGLFGYAKGSEIKNLTISEAKVTASQNVGLLIGCGEGCTIKNVSVAGRVNAETNTALLVGSVNNITAEIVCAEGYAEGGENVAGLIGCATDSSINNAFTVANVSACNNAGGFVGTAIYTTLTYGYAAGSTTSSGSQGGVFGTATESTVISSFFDKSQAGDNGYGKAVTAEALLKRETFSDWDFINVWEMSDGITKPFFRHLDTKWVKRVGTSQCKLNLSGFLAPDDFQDICDSLEVALYASEDNTMIVEPKMINTLPVKEKSLKIQYNAKKRMFKYTSTLPSVTLARFDGQVAAPCEVTKPKRKLNFTSTLNEDISNELIGKWICLSDDCMEFHILSGTKVKLSNNGKSLTYKGTVKNVTMQISLSIKNRKFNMKYVAPNTINLVTEE